MHAMVGIKRQKGKKKLKNPLHIAVAWENTH